ncbi:MAG: hypothetical protein HY547_04510 [Elusimicrobia bacterium]|nr:hypothetical protein [Elusimicrobiota bacterium]
MKRFCGALVFAAISWSSPLGLPAAGPEQLASGESRVYDGSSGKIWIPERVRFKHGVAITEEDSLVSRYRSDGDFEKRVVSDAVDRWSIGLEHEEYVWVPKPEWIERHRVVQTREIVDRTVFVQHWAGVGFTWGLLGGLAWGVVAAGLLGSLGVNAIFATAVGLTAALGLGLLGRYLGLSISKNRPVELPDRARYYQKHVPIERAQEK